MLILCAKLSPEMPELSLNVPVAGGRATAVDSNKGQSQSVGLTFENIFAYLKNIHQSLLRKNLKNLSLKNVRKRLHLTKSAKAKGYGKLITDEEKRWLEEYHARLPSTRLYSVPYDANM